MHLHQPHVRGGTITSKESESSRFCQFCSYLYVHIPKRPLIIVVAPHQVVNVATVWLKAAQVVELSWS